MHKTVKRITRCKGCGNRIDPEWCHCGLAVDDHTMYSGHGPIPMGCTCGYEKPIKRLVKRLRYSPSVEARLDPARPKYSEAVKTLAAFAPDERKFQVLVSHLDAACKEARGRIVADLRTAARRIKR